MQALNTTTFSKGITFETVATKQCADCGENFDIRKVIVNGVVKSEGNLNETKCYSCQKKDEERDIAKQIAEEQKKWEKRRKLKMFEKYSLVSEDLDQASFGNYNPDHPSKEEAKRKTLWYAQNFKKVMDKELKFQSLLLQGTYGLGKSHLAYSIADEVKKQGYVVIFVDTPSLLRVIRESYSKNNEYSETDILKAVNDADLVVLDDLGAEYVKSDGSESWAVDKLFQVIQSRIGKPTVYTTNYKSTDLADKYGQHGGRIVSRMMKGTNIVKFDGDDYRLKGWS